MNRRNFLKNSALALFGFTVLPPARTYERIWKAQRKPLARILINPAYVNAPYEMGYLFANGIQEYSVHSREKLGAMTIFTPYPKRYVQENGVMRQVFPFILDTSELKGYFS
jgi:hypothetical protein